MKSTAWKKKPFAAAIVYLGLTAAIAGWASPQGENAGSGLKSLTVRTTLGWGGTLTPAFSEGVKSYTVKLAGDCAGIEVTAVAGKTGIPVTINGKRVASLTPTIVKPPVGASKISIVVGKSSSRGSVYEIAVDREDLRPRAERFLRLRFDDPETGISMVYRLFVPDGYESGKRYPLVLYLHGAGELDTDDAALLTGNQGPAVWARKEEQAKRPCFVLVPHCHRSTGGSGAGAPLGWTSLMKNGPVPSGGRTPFAPNPQLAVAYRILEKVLAEYPVDPKRIYLTGLSMGGFGAWAMALDHPDSFAALVPICGGGDPAGLSRIAKMPIWAFHGAADPVVPASVSRASIAALVAAGGTPEYTEYPHETFFLPNAHFSWVPAYADEKMREWLFAQER
jgi:dienelactone hydrolase